MSAFDRLPLCCTLFALLLLVGPWSTLAQGADPAMEKFEDTEEHAWPVHNVAKPVAVVPVPAKPLLRITPLWMRFRPTDKAIERMQWLVSSGVSAYQANDALTSARHLSGRGMREAQMGSVVLSGSVHGITILVDTWSKYRRRHRSTATWGNGSD